MKLLKYTLLIFVCWFMVHATAIVIDGLTDDDTKSDVAVIFGNTVNPDGSLSPRLQARLDRGLQLYQDSLAKVIVVSGGLGKEGHYEGTKMAEYLISKGVPESRIIVDNEGNNSETTVLNVQKLGFDQRSITVVSQYHHISRAKLAFRRNGFSHVYGAHADYVELRDVYSIVREFVGYYKYLVF